MTTRLTGKIILFCLLLLFCFTPVAAQEDRHDFKKFFAHVLNDQKDIWTFPIRKESWTDKRTWLCIALSAPAFAFDGEPARRLREDPSFFGFNDVFDSKPIDVGLVAVPFALAITGEIARQTEVSEIGWKTSEAAVDAVVVGNVLRLVTQRSRPHTGREYGFWQGGNSFPSGHSMVAWSVVAAAVKHYKERRWVAWILYPAAGLISFSRLSSGNHFFSDVAVGSVLGYVIGRHVVD